MIEDRITKIRAKLAKQMQAVFPDRNGSAFDSAFVRGTNIDDEVLAATEYFVGRCWKDVDPAVWSEHRNALALMQPRAACYYLPALILNSLVDLQSSETAVEDLILTLAMGGEPERRAERDFFWANFDLAQLFLIGGWLAWLQNGKKYDDDEIANALSKVCKFIEEHILALT